MNTRSVHNQFSSKTGSGHIANPKFLSVLSRQLSDSTLMVDYGAGIGTVSALALSLKPSIEILAVEPDAWCRGQFQKNVVPPHREKAVRIIPKLPDDFRLEYDHIVAIDMEFLEPSDPEKILISSASCILVEGHRYKQRKLLVREALRLGIGLKYCSFLGFPRSRKGGAVFLTTAFGFRRSVLMRLTLIRMGIVTRLKLGMMESLLGRYLLRA